MLLVLFVAFGVHANTLFNGFVYDDAKQVLANRWMTDARFLGDILTNDGWVSGRRARLHPITAPSCTSST